MAEVDDSKLDEAYQYWHDCGFDEGYDEGYDLGYCDGWDAAQHSLGEEVEEDD